TPPGSSSMPQVARNRTRAAGNLSPATDVLALTDCAHDRPPVRTGLFWEDTMRKLLTVLLLLGLLAVGAAPALASGADAPGAAPLFFSDRGVLLRSHRVTVSIDEQVATTRFEQVFYNDSPRPAEGTYLFPLPPGAAVSNLIMFVDGQPVEAKI